MSVGSGLLFATGFFVGVVLRSVLLGVLLFALGAILFAIRGYLNFRAQFKATLMLRQAYAAPLAPQGLREALLAGLVLLF